MSKTITELEMELQSKDNELEEVRNELQAAQAERDTYLGENKDLRDAAGTPNETFEAEKKKLENQVKEKEKEAAEKTSAAEAIKKELDQTKIQLLRERIGHEFPSILPEWLTETTEEGMRAQAAKFAEHLKKNAPAPVTPAKPAGDPAPANPVVQPTATGAQVAAAGGPGVFPTVGPGELDEAKKRLKAAQEANNGQGDLTAIAKAKMEINKLGGGRVEIEREG